jgi:hypothetical protein
VAPHVLRPLPNIQLDPLPLLLDVGAAMDDGPL